MSTDHLTRYPLTLVREYLADFLSTLVPWLANCCMVSPWSDGSLDQALQALRADEPEQAAKLLTLAAEQAAEPVPADEAHLPQVQEERIRISLAVSVAQALLERATELDAQAGQSATGVSRHPNAILSPATPVHARDTGAPLDLPDSWADVEPLPEDLILVFEWPGVEGATALPAAPGPACAPHTTQPTQG